MRALFLATFLFLSAPALCQIVVLDSTLQRYFAPIHDTTVTVGRPPATRLYVYTTTDLLYNACSIAWQLCYVEDGNTYTLTTGQVQMAGADYVAYAADNRDILNLFAYAAAKVGVTFIP